MIPREPPIPWAQILLTRSGPSTISPRSLLSPTAVASIGTCNPRAQFASAAQAGSQPFPSSIAAPRNPLGVQLLAPSLSAQIFPPASTPLPPLHPHAVSLSHAHLASHGLSPSQGSVLKPTEFPLPPLQGKDLGEHFWNIGREAAQPWLSLAEDLAASEIPEPPSEMARNLDPAPEVDEEGRPSPAHWISMDASLRAMMDAQAVQWIRRSGWTKYPILTSADGRDTILGEGQEVPFPDTSDGALVFDVETMVTAGPFSVLACAVGLKAWYAWISPWLLGETDRKDQLIPFGDKGGERLLVGHRVSYDRARVRDEYQLRQSQIRFMDTLSLHVAVRGMSSPQRPLWSLYRKKIAQKAAQKLLDDQQLQDEQRQELLRLLGGEEVDAAGLGILRGLDLDLEAFSKMDSASASTPSPAPFDESEHSAKQLNWEDVSSGNSLAELGALYCNVQLTKELRNVFVEAKDRGEILDQLGNLLNYCAKDVSVTHGVFAKVLPAFRENCPHPASFAGVLTLGSPVLPVDSEWVQFQERCQEKYEHGLEGVRAALLDLAEGLRKQHDKMCKLGQCEWWLSDPWLSQLDWTAKKAKNLKLASPEDSLRMPRWYRSLIFGKNPPSAAQGTAVEMLLLSLNGQLITKREGKWRAGTYELPSIPTSRKFLESEVGKCVRSEIGAEGEAVVAAVRGKAAKAEVSEKIRAAAAVVLAKATNDEKIRNRLSALDWAAVDPPPLENEATSGDGSEGITWPKWYWDLFNPSSGVLDVTIRTRIAPLLLKISWRGCPLYHSREHGWVYLHRPSRNPDFSSRKTMLVFKHESDAALERLVIDADSSDPVCFYKVPHSAGDDANVGSPFAKAFLSLFENSTLRSEHPDEIGKRAARDALTLNAQCSYWAGVRERVASQMVVWEGEGETEMGIQPGASGMRTGEAEAARRKGIILPQIIVMGTVTRRAIEKTWLTASNAKKNRVGSELKAMVKAPPGWAIVGADVDSEELWICSVMGDAQFGLHGATAVGWMTLEGNKTSGTDLHSKTAGILGTDRNNAKVFNYSRIYGAGIRHATQLLLKANPAMAKEEAIRLSKELYAKTKGNNTHSTDNFGRRFWYGGSESYVFNKLEDVAVSNAPRTPALDCGITDALSRKLLPKKRSPRGQSVEEFMPSRVNWVVQSSGVDYLHLLVISMNHLIRHYNIDARFMLSVHDEVRYLVKDEDAHRAALALQISNLWTRAMFSFKLQIEGLPEGVAWFAQVDIDKVLRKEVDDPCVTPSQPDPIPSGQAYEIADTLEKTHGGSLWKDGRTVGAAPCGDILRSDAYPPYVPSGQQHRATDEQGMLYLQAQASGDIDEIRALERRAQGLKMKMAGTCDQADRAGIKTKGSGSAQSTDQAHQEGVYPSSRMTEEHDYMMPNQADLNDIWTTLNTSYQSATPPARKTSSPSTAKEGSRARPPLQFASARIKNTPRQGPPGQRNVASVRYSTSTTNPVSASILELAQQMPVRGRGLQRSPRVQYRARYWETPEYNRFVRWFLYRRLLAALSQQFPSEETSQCYADVKCIVKTEFRVLKWQKLNPQRTAKSLQRALQLLVWTQSVFRDPAALPGIRGVRRRFREQQLRKERQLAQWRRRTRGGRLTGALYRPDLSIGATLRRKPQPVGVGAMIHRRRKQHRLRVARLRDLIEEKDMLVAESAFHAQLRSGDHAESSVPQSGERQRRKERQAAQHRGKVSPLSVTMSGEPVEWKASVERFGPVETWIKPLRDFRETMRKQFQVEDDRRNEQFTPEQLRLAKRLKSHQRDFVERKAEKRKALAASALADGVMKTRTGWRKASRAELARLPEAEAKVERAFLRRLKEKEDKKLGRKVIDRDEGFKPLKVLLAELK